jgi:tetratricopeptide (TPR) repeat protein
MIAPNNGKAARPRAGITLTQQMNLANPRKTRRTGRRATNPPAFGTFPPATSRPVNMDQTLRDLRKLVEKKEFGSIDELNAYIQNILVNSGGRIPHPPPESDLERAQELADQALEAPSTAGRLKLAREALAISPDCAAAHLILADHESHPAKQRALLEQALAAGKRAVGAETFTLLERDGQFWGMVETRPYMRAAARLAELVWLMGDRRAAIEQYQRLLRLNPGDNLGLRYLLAHCLLEEQTVDAKTALDALLAAYPDDAACCWAYSAALLAFQRLGPSDGADLALQRALGANKFVPPYLLGDKHLPPELPTRIRIGDESEAIDYANLALKAWFVTPGALAWLDRRFRFSDN